MTTIHNLKCECNALRKELTALETTKKWAAPKDASALLTSLTGTLPKERETGGTRHSSVTGTWKPVVCESEIKVSEEK